MGSPTSDMINPCGPANLRCEHEPQRFSDVQIAPTPLAGADSDCCTEEERLLRRAMDGFARKRPVSEAV